MGSKDFSYDEIEVFLDFSVHWQISITEKRLLLLSI